MTSFVLVHGSFHGGWCWQRVTPFLEALGHEVFPVTLTGLGERSHLLTPEIDLNTHVQDVVNTLFYEDLHDVVLVGHSYGSIVVRGVADQMADRLKHVVFFDAGIPKNGEGPWTMFSQRGKVSLIERAERDGEGWKVPPMSPRQFGVEKEEDVAWAASKLTAHPLKSMQSTLTLNGPLTVPGTLICCTADKTERAIERMKQYAAEENVNYRELDSVHDAMITDPDKLAALLLEIGG